MANGEVCSFKSITKFCLLYFTTLLLLTVIFTGVNNEPMDDEQTAWWWGFLVALIATAAMSASALALLIYSDYTKKPPLADIEHFIQVRKSPIPIEPSNSSSYKTILTINSQQTNDQEKTAKSPGFVNLTPKSAVNPITTIVDVKAERKKNEHVTAPNATPIPPKERPKSDMKEPSNLGAIPSDTLASTINGKGKKNKRNKKRKKQKPTD